MSEKNCRRCGSGGLVTGFMSVRCPICGDCQYLPVADERAMWAEHRLGLMFARGGWRWLDVFEPPAWFIREVA